jgi:hypothetical protein
MLDGPSDTHPSPLWMTALLKRFPLELVLVGLSAMLVAGAVGVAAGMLWMSVTGTPSGGA